VNRDWLVLRNVNSGLLMIVDSFTATGPLVALAVAFTGLFLIARRNPE
jgi:hypothetical protein